MSKTKKKIAIELLLAEVQGAFVDVEAVHLAEIEQAVKHMKKACDEGWEALDRVHERLGLYMKAAK